MGEWAHRKDTRRGDMAHGITFDMWEREMKNCRGEAAYEDKKFHLDGKVSLTLAQNQYKYGDELIAQVYGNAGIFRERRASNYCRVQVYLGKADLETAKALEDIAKAIREKEAK